MEHFYAKKHRLLTEMQVQARELQTLLSLLSEHEETSPAGDCSEFYNLGISLDETQALINDLSDAVLPLAQRR